MSNQQAKQQPADQPNPFVAAFLGNSEKLYEHINERVDADTGTTKEQRIEKGKQLMEGFKHRLEIEGRR